MSVRSHLLVMAALAASIGLAGCEAGPQAPHSRTAEAETTPAPAATEAPAAPAAQDFAAAPELKNVHFALDQARIRSADARRLEGNAKWLKSRRDVAVLVSGHADERGNEGYNMQLAERRAETVKQYLIAQGVEADRISTTSHGENQPVCSEHGEACWSKNRRADFQVKPR